MSRAHVEHSPSGAERWWNCPGSIALCRTVPRVPSSPAALEGTAAHAVLERCLKHPDGFLNPYDLEGMTIEGFEVTEEMADAISVAIEFVKAELQIGGKLAVEKRVEVIPGVIEGTLDIAIVRPFDRVIINDFKYGKGVLVRPEYNKQLMIYALGLLREYDAPMFELVITQPRAFDGDPIARWECSRADLEAFALELERHVALTKEPNAMCISGQSQCKWCDAKAVCPQIRADLGKALAPVKGSELLFPAAGLLPMATVVKVLEHTDLIKDWMKSVWAHAEMMLEKGVEVPGYELKKRRAHRKWVDEAQVAAMLTGLGDKIFTLKLRSPAQIEKLVKGKDAKAELKELIETPDKGATIAKVGGKKGGKKDA